MSSGFVSGGTVDKPTERDYEWKQAQRAITEARLRKLDENSQHDGKSLFEVLQANKAAKQEAFEEASKLKNQFRSLDEDEIEFLRSVAEKKRATEAAVRAEDSEQLKAFHEQRELAEQDEDDVHENVRAEHKSSNDVWSTAPRKRKRLTGQDQRQGKQISKIEGQNPSIMKPAHEQDVHIEEGSGRSNSKNNVAATQQSTAERPASSVSSSHAVAVAGLGLAAYDSDDD